MLSIASKVLIAEDFEMTRLMLRNCLVKLGYTKIEEALDGGQAAAMIEKAASSPEPYGLILCDWNMPKLTGIDVLKTCRMNPKTIRTPFVMVTAESERKYVVQALSAGATDYIVKPFTEASIGKKLEKIAARLNR